MNFLYGTPASAGVTDTDGVFVMPVKTGIS